MIRNNNLKTITDHRQDTQLSNIKQQDFKSNLIKISDNIYTFPIILSDNSSMNIPVREDGYINLTLLCKAGNKLFKNWHENKQTKALIKALENEVGIQTSQLIEVKKGNSTKFTQGSWGIFI